VIGAISPVDRLIVVNVDENSTAGEDGYEMGMVLMQSKGKDVSSLEQFYHDLAGASEQGKLSLLFEDKERTLSLTGQPERGILVGSIFKDSAAYAAGLPAMSVITEIDGRKAVDLVGFRELMNSTHPGQMVNITTAAGRTYAVNLTARDAASKEQGGFIGIAISGNAVFSGGATFQQAPARQFLEQLKAMPGMGMSGFHLLLSLPFAGVPGLSQKGFPGFSGWLTTVFEPSGWAEPLGEKLFWIANLLLWIGWINLYAGLFNCLPAVPLDGGHIFRDLVQSGFERIVKAEKAERLTRTTVAILTWLVLTSLLITLIAPFTNGLSI
jgi:membrane-associated protease RseP (regulator of RpoE activity)